MSDYQANLKEEDFLVAPTLPDAMQDATPRDVQDVSDARNDGGVPWSQLGSAPGAALSPTTPATRGVQGHDGSVRDDGMTIPGMATEVAADGDNDNRPEAGAFMADDDVCVLESSMVVEGDRMSDYQDQLNEEDMPDYLLSEGEFSPPREESNEFVADDATKPSPPSSEAALPEGWTEALEPATNRVYYYNRITGASAWDRPAAVSEEIPGPKGSVATGERAAAANAAVGKEGRPEPGVVATGEGEAPAAVADDPPSSNLGACEGTTAAGGEHRQQPRVEEEFPPENVASGREEGPPSSSAEEAGGGDGGALVEGWIEATDPVATKVYYYNEVTGDSSWDRPLMSKSFVADDGIPLAEAGPEPASVAGEEATASGIGPDGETPEPPSSEERGAAVPADVIAENETSASPDGMAHDPVAEEPLETRVAEEGGSAVVIGEGEQPAAGASAEEILGLVAEDGGGPEPAAREEVDDASSASSSPDGWIEAAVPGTGNVYYYNQVTQQWSDIPESETHEHTEDETSIQSELSLRTEPSVNTEDSAAATDLSFESLPAGWIEANDPSSSKVYYYNEETGATTWDRPLTTDDAEDSAGKDGLLAEEEDNVVAAGSEVLEEATMMLANDAGELRMDETKNANEEESLEEKIIGIETTLEDVEGTNAASSVDEKEKASSPEAVIHPATDTLLLPEGWIEGVDPSSGKTYYYQQETGVSSWERPPLMDGAVDGEKEVAPTGKEEVAEADVAATSAVGAKIPLEQHTKDPTEESTTPASEIVQESSSEVENVDKETFETASMNQAENIEQTEATEQAAESAAIGDNERATQERSVQRKEENDCDDAEVDAVVNDESMGEWIEATDPSTGNVYYYNATAGVTSWIRPVLDTDTILVEKVGRGVEEQMEENEVLLTVDGGKKSETEFVVKATSANSGPANVMTDVDAPEPVATVLQDDAKEEAAADNQIVDGQAVANKDVADSEKNLEEEVAPDEGWTQVEYSGQPTESLHEQQQQQQQECSEEEMTTSIVKEDNESSTKQQEAVPMTTSNEEDIISIESTGEEDKDDIQQPEGWVEVIDPSSGKIYYYNEVTGVTSWDRPKNEEVDVVLSEHPSKKEPALAEEQQTQKDAASSSKEDDSHETAPKSKIEGSLVAVNSPSSAAEAAEGKSTITPAVEEMVSESRLDDAAAGNAVDTVMETTAPSEDANTLPDQWIETVDPSSGKTYYYNEESGATSWERPMTEKKTESGDDGVQSAKDDSDEFVESAGGAIDEKVSKLDETHDEPVEDSFEEGGSPESSAQTASVIPKGTASASNENESDERMKSEESSATANGPSAARAESTTTTPAIEVTTTESSRIDDAALVSSAVDKALPDGWIETLDPSSGKTYYYNSESGATSWEIPLVEKKYESGDGSKGAKDDSDSVEGEGAGGRAGMESVAAVIGVATEEKMLKAGDTHDESGENSSDVAEKSTTSPSAVDETTESRRDDATVDSAASVAMAKALPDGWVEAIDPSSGKTYYYNQESNATSWDRPLAEKKPEFADGTECAKDDADEIVAGEGANMESVAETDVAAPPDVTAEEEVSKADDTHNEPVGSSSVEGGSPELSAPATSALREGWVEVADPNSGKAYYYNETLGETSWDRPSPPTLKEATEISVENAPAAAAAKHSHTGAHAAATTVTTTTNHRPRPAHAIAHFGFGGRLCVMIPQVAASLSNGAVLQPPGKSSLPRPMRRGSVVIHRLRDLIPRDHEHSIPLPASSKASASCHSPLIKTPEDQVLSYFATKCCSPSSKSNNPEEDDNLLLWNVINIAAQNRGRLRNDKRAKGAIVDLLLSTAANEDPGDTTKSPDDAGEETPPPLVATATNDLAALEEVQSLLLRGERESAVSEALCQKNYALALVIASMCDRTTYQIAARRFADEALKRGSPLHTATLLFSNNLEIPEVDPYNPSSEENSSSSSFWSGEEYGDLERSWREQLASIMSNQTVGWERIVLKLGDRLLQLGHCQAAHVCYLVSFTPFGSPTKHTARLVLLGCDHTLTMHRMLMTPESIEGFQRTEAFEWARRRGNRKTHIPVLQPFKLRYAELLADFGWEEAAREYLLSIRTCIGLSAAGSDNVKGNSSSAGQGSSSSTTASGNFSVAMLQDDAFIESMKRLDDRICVSTGHKQSSWEKNEDGFSKGGATAVLGSIVKSVLGKKQPKVPEGVLPPQNGSRMEDKYGDKQQDRICPELEDEHVVGEQTCGLELTTPQLQPQPVKVQNMPLAITEGGTESNPDKYVSFTPNAMPKMAETPARIAGTQKLTPLLSNPFSHDDQVGGLAVVGVDNNFPMKGGTSFKTDDGQASPMPLSAPPTLAVDVITSKTKNEERQPKQPNENKKERTKLLSFSSQASKKKEDKKNKAPASEPPRSAGWLPKFLRRGDNEPKATVADVGEDMKAYFDDKARRWIFPGDDPAEVAKPLAPPPIIPQKTDEAPATPLAAPAAESDSIDPLAALMAPPSRAMSSKKKGTSMTPTSTIMRSKKVLGFPETPSVPQFAVFQPKPASDSIKQDEKSETPSVQQFAVFQPKPASDPIK